MAARRALDFAAGGDDALLAAALKGAVSWQLLVSGRFLDAETVAARTAESIEPLASRCRHLADLACAPRTWAGRSSPSRCC